jgi:hypothetical protein
MNGPRGLPDRWVSTMVMKPLRRVIGRVRSVAFDPALYVTAFTFYAGINRWITADQLALCYAGTVLVTVLHQLWERRRWEGFSFAGELKSGVLWGTALFVIGFAWGSTCGFILDWMAQPGWDFR